jgi:LysR family transcriptional regulator, glycine cleavage system transcriptional activator
MIGSRDAHDLHYEYLFTSQMTPVCSPSMLSGDHDINEPDDLAKQTLLQVYPSSKDWYVWLDGTGVKGVDPEAGLQFDSYDLALSTAVQGLGIALGMQPYVSRDLQSGLLVELFPEQRVKTAGEWYLVCRQERTNSAKVIAFREWLLREINADPDLVESR